MTKCWLTKKILVPLKSVYLELVYLFQTDDTSKHWKKIEKKWLMQKKKRPILS